MFLPRVTLGSLSQIGVQQALDLLTRMISLQLGKVRVSATDTVLNFLGAKLAAGTGITLTVLNPGANEQVSIAADGKVLVSATDTVLDFLGAKLAAGSNITLTVLNPGGNEQVSIAAVVDSPFTVVPTAVDYAANLGDYVLGTTTGGDIAITLPTAVGNVGRQIGVKKVSLDGFFVNVTPFGAQTIDGEPLQSIADQYTALTIMSDGANWLII